MVSRDISDSWAILDLVYINTLSKLYIFLIDNTKHELYLFSKQLNDRFTNSIQNKLKKLKDPKIKENPTQFEKIKTSLNRLWPKLFPTSLTDFLIKQKFRTLMIISQNFLVKLPWNSIRVKKQTLAQIFNVQRGSSLNKLILEKSVEKA